MSNNKPRCSKCGRVLTSPQSIARGIGPECAGLTGGKGPTKPGRPRKGRRGTYNAGVAGGSSSEIVVHEVDHEPSVAKNIEDSTKGQ